MNVRGHWGDLIRFCEKWAKGVANRELRDGANGLIVDSDLVNENERASFDLPMLPTRNLQQRVQRTEPLFPKSHFLPSSQAVADVQQPAGLAAETSIRLPTSDMARNYIRALRMEDLASHATEALNSLKR
tara:strand:+ start:99 stop:488 length:390 start_codon:yes stop_codon:yes gene_type:complete